jgi:carboxyl-terminal processing protease
VREADLQRHLENGRIKEEKEQAPPRVRPAPGAAPAEQKPPTELGSKDDFQLSQAIAFLKGEPVKSQSPTVAQTQPN